MTTDSLDKIVEHYVAAVVSKSFTYRRRLIRAMPLRVSPGIFSGYTCPDRCAGCCPRFSLEYLPSESYPYSLTSYIVEINKRPVFFFHDVQAQNRDHFCQNVDKGTGRCSVHGLHPFHCDFELLRVAVHADHYEMSQRLYSRGWNMLRVDGERGARCEMLPSDTPWKQDVLRRLLRLQKWTDHMGLIETRLPTILSYVESGPHTEPLWLPGRP